MWFAIASEKWLTLLFVIVLAAILARELGAQVFTSALAWVRTATITIVLSFSVFLHLYKQDEITDLHYIGYSLWFCMLSTGALVSQVGVRKLKDERE